jgi:hypothetical protein
MNTQQLAYSYKQISASGNVCANDGVLGGIFVSAASATPTIAVYDDAAVGTGTKIVDTFTPTAGQWYPMPFAFSKGLNVVISGTVSATIAYVMG